jgi:heat shock protein HtpX
MAAMYDQVAANKRRSAVLMLVFVLFVGLVAALVAYLLAPGLGIFAIVIAFVVAAGMAFVSYWKSDSVALAMSRAKPASVEEYPRLHNIVEGLCIASGLPKPRLYIIDDPAPNAFATGRNAKHAAVAVTTGLIDKMNRIELEAVLAHELSHVKNDDILVSTLAVTLVGVVALLADIGVRGLFFGGGRNRDNQGGNIVTLVIALLAIVFLILSPLIAQLMQFAVSRRRESLADMSGVEMTRYPPGLISALEKLKADQTVVNSASRATAHLWIESPLARTPEEGKLSRLNRLYDTHPPLEERIAALQEL